MVGTSGIVSGFDARRRGTERKIDKAINDCLPPLFYPEALERRMLLSVSGSLIAGPLTTKGATWTYQITTADNQTASYTNTVIGQTTFNGKTVYDLREIFPKAVSDIYSGFLADGDYVSYGTHGDSQNFGISDDVFSPYELGYPARVTGGVIYTSNYTDTSTSYDSDGASTSSDDQVTETGKLVSETKESITVPFGTFQAYHLQYLSNEASDDGNGGTTTTTTTSDQWYAPGIGLIKAVDDSGNIDELTSFSTSAEHLAFSTQPADADKGDTLAPVKVSVLKTDNSVDADAEGSITLSLAAVTGNAKLSGTVTRPLVNGIATFDDLKIDGGGTYTLQAVDDATLPVTNTTSSKFTINTSGLTWTGKGDGVNWSDAKNWDENVKPVNGDSLVFPSGSPLTTNNDLTGLSIASIDIAGGGYTLKGNAIKLTTGLTSEAGNNTYDIDTTLVGSPAIKGLAGNLTIKSVLSGGSLSIGGAGTVTFTQQNTYTGATTLQAGVTIDDDVLNGALGTGAVTIGAGTDAVAINAGSGGVATLNNDISFEDGSTLANDPQVILGGTITVNGQDTLAPVGAGDELTIDADTIKGAGTLIVKGGGKVSIKGSLIAAVNIIVTAGELDFDGTLNAAVDGPSQITVKGGTLRALSLAGTGQIQVISGKFIAPPVAATEDYSGNVRLDRSGAGQPAASIILGTATGLGSGALILTAPTSTDGNTPLIDASSAGGVVTLDNVLTMRTGSTLIVTGKLAFIHTASFTGATAEIDTLVSTDSILFSAAMNSPIGVFSAVTLDGPGAMRMEGTVGVGVTLKFGGNRTGSTGSLTVDANLGGILGVISANTSQLVLQGGQLVLLHASGTGGIDLQSGNVSVVSMVGYTGTITVEQSPQGKPPVKVTLLSDTTLGTGNLIINGPAGGAASIPLFDASGAASAPTIANAITFNSGAALNVAGTVIFAGDVSLTGAAAVNTVSKNDKVTFGGTLSGSIAAVKRLTLDGPGHAVLTGTVSLGLKIIYGSKLTGTTGDLTLSANIGGSLSTPLAADANQINVQGGKVSLVSLTGYGGIDMQSGTLVAGASGGYSGQITLEQSDSGLPIPSVIINNLGTLGTGDLVVKGSQSTTGGIPLIDASNTTDLVTLKNTLVMQDGAIVTVTGNVAFTDAVSLVGASTQINTLTSSDKLTFTGGLTGTLDGVPKVVLDGPGQMDVLNRVAINVTITFGPKNAGSTGTLLLDTALGGVLAAHGQVIVQGGTVVLSSTSGLGSIDVKSGTLVAGKAALFTGIITLFASAAGAPAAKIIVGDNANLGTGKIIVGAGALTDDNIPVIDATGTSGDVALENTLSMKTGAILKVTGTIDFTAAVDMAGSKAELKTLAEGDNVTLQGGVDANFTTPVLTLDGPGNITVGGTVSEDATLVLGLASAGATGTFVLGTDLGGVLGSISTDFSQVVVKGGTVILDKTHGSGGIDMESGTLQGGNVNDYDGTIILEQSAAGLPSARLLVTTGKSFGTGQIAVLGGAGGADNVPTIDAGDATTAVVVKNNLVLQDGATLNVTGLVTFSKEVSLTGATAAVHTLGSSDVLTFKAGLSGPLTSASTISLDGPGSILVGDTLPLGTKITFGETLAGPTGLLVIGADLGGLSGVLSPTSSQVTLKDGRLLLNKASGNGGIDIQGGTLLGQSGNPDYSGKITLEAGTIAITDTSDTVALGTGTLVLKGGRLENDGTSTATLGNPVSIQGLVILSSQGQRLKFTGSLELLTTGTLDAIGSIALTGALTGGGNIVLDGDVFAVSGSNLGLTAAITIDSGTIEVTENNALGLGAITAQIANGVGNLGQAALIAVNSIGDPLLSNPLIVKTGKLVIKGQFTFPNGITVAKGAAIEIETAGSQVIDSGPLAGAGNIIVDDGTSFVASGDQSGFTGTITHAGAAAPTTPTLAVTDAGGPFTGLAYAAVATLTGTDGQSSTLDGIAPTLTYYVGTKATGNGSTAAPSAVGTYTVVASFAGSAHYNAAVSSPVTFIISPASSTNTAPTITQNPTSQLVAAGAEVILTAGAAGTPTPTIQWQISTDGGKTFANIAGATGNTLDLGAATVAESGNQYRAIFTNSAGAATTDAAALTVSPIVVGQTGTITGTLWNDSDGNGKFDHGEVATGVRMVFIDANGNGKLDAGERFTMSDAKGQYTFTEVPVGMVKISRVFPNGYHLSNPTAAGGIDVIAAVIAGATTTVNLGTYGSNPVIPPEAGTITGTLWNDSNHNGIFDRGELATGVRTVFIDTNGNGRLDAGERSTKSNAKGKYRFSNVPIGRVRISRVFPIGFRLSNASAGTAGHDVLTTLTAGGTSLVNLGTTWS